MTISKEDFEKANKVGLGKLVRHSIKLYNKLCGECRLKTVRINKRGAKVKLNDYCPECKEKALKLLEAFK